ncbi:serine hydrolase domain-containing protein [Salinibius halmophilus]|uniref:serine hydrolase domain-containing protein n=1 Tax=Salinibius halmophilus TaxID=1853216 RepID=UPI000E671565|nr:serine hydrolase domain-containing protein [Salinibius halmophilus]
MRFSKLWIFALSSLILVGCTTPKLATSEFKQQLSQTYGVDQPGGAYAVYHNGKIIDQHFFGMADIEEQRPFDADTQLYLASVSKHFTTFAILMLEEQGKLSLQDPIHNYLPEMPDYANDVTIEQLMMNTSGIRDDATLLRMHGTDGNSEASTELMLSMIYRQQTLNFAPGSDYIYSNAGFTLLAEIIENITEQSFESWMQENVFVPLEMENTGYPTPEQFTLPMQATAYLLDHSSENNFTSQTIQETANGATGVVTTLADLAKWIDNFDSRKVGAAAVSKLMSIPHAAPRLPAAQYGYGLSYSVMADESLWIQHGGDLSGYSAGLVYLPEQKIAAVAFTNASPNIPAQAYASMLIQHAAFDAAAPEVPELPSTAQAVELTDLGRFTGIYTYSRQYFGGSGFIEIIETERGLAIKQHDGNELYLTPISELERGTISFMVAGSPYEITFRMTKSSGARSFSGLNGDDTSYRRAREVQQIDPELVGTYFSPELGAYQLELTDDPTKLVINFPAGLTVEAIQKNDEILTKWGSEYIDIIRDESGSITALTLETERVRGIVLEKQQP